ncbi:MAG: hypothetical protein RL193_712 [Actinomycetota bacterium]|jgi:hypothetical protein
MNPLSRGVITIHSCPMALIRHVEWSIESLLGQLHFEWRSQPLIAGTQKTQIEWRSAKDLSADLSSALKSWHYLRFEIASTSQLFRHTPELGIHRAEIDGIGNILITENQVRFAMGKSDDEMRQILDVALGTEWEVELERFRGVDLQEIAQLRAI